MFCDLVDCSPPGSSVCGIFQARILEWVATSFSRDLPDPGIEPGSLAVAGKFFTTQPPGKFLSLATGFNLNQIILTVPMQSHHLASQHFNLLLSHLSAF